MQRSAYYNYIEERLVTLCRRIKSRAKINVLDYHMYAENLFRDLFNRLYSWNLSNLNYQTQNAEAIDLIDTANKIIFQVSATNTKTKIDDALNKQSLASKEYKGFNFKFLSITKDAKNLRNRTYSPPEGIFFTPASDIYDIDSILKDINNLDIKTLFGIYDLIKDELGPATDVVRLESNLATVINILSKENLTSVSSTIINDVFEIERKIDFNLLHTTKKTIAEYKQQHHIVDRIYSAFDKIGSNKSISVLNAINSEYLNYSSELNGDELFNQVSSAILKRILDSSNFEPIPREELEMCVGILTVDAFIRCKIFENPNDCDYATP